MVVKDPLERLILVYGHLLLRILIHPDHILKSLGKFNLFILFAYPLSLLSLVHFFIPAQLIFLALDVQFHFAYLLLHEHSLLVLQL